MVGGLSHDAGARKLEPVGDAERKRVSKRTARQNHETEGGVKATDVKVTYWGEQARTFGAGEEWAWCLSFFGGADQAVEQSNTGVAHPYATQHSRRPSSQS